MELKETLRRMHGKKLYFCNNDELVAEQAKCLDRLYEYNHTRPTEPDKREALLREMFAEIGENCTIEPPLHANRGGKYVHFGSGVYANFGLTLVDDTTIRVGDNVMFGPHVTLTAGTHPIHPELRRRTAQYNLPITIGSNVWLGANVVVLPGVTIGENTVVGAGSVVTGDLPANVVAVGIPCRVVREIGEQDRLFYDHDRPIDVE